MNLRLVFLLVAIALFSCGHNKEVQLPKAHFSVLSKLENHSMIYLFFNKVGKDTLVEVNRKNAISSTNWVFSVDKRLPLQEVIPEIQFLQAKKENSPHKSEGSQNLFAYANDSLQSLAFIPFTRVNYLFGHPCPTPKDYVLAVSKTGAFLHQAKPITIQTIRAKVAENTNQNIHLLLVFDSAMNFETYLRAKITFAQKGIKQLSTTEYIN